MKRIWTITACMALLCAGTALAIPTAQQQCDFARITAWKVYTSCVDTVVAKDAKGGPHKYCESCRDQAIFTFDEYDAFAKCRHAYFKKWNAFQQKASLGTSTCIGLRYTDNGDQTVTDNLT